MITVYSIREANGERETGEISYFSLILIGKTTRWYKWVKWAL